MFLLREVEPKDIDDLLRLAESGTFLNLPRDRAALSKKIVKSVNSFRGKLKDPRDGEYLFVAEDRSTGRVVGTSLIIAQHGTPEEPHVYFMVLPKKKVSKSIHMGFLHQVLRLGFNFDGPSEIGGLVLQSEYRGHAEKVGLQLSFIRFVYIASRRPAFRSEILSELLPPFTERGESHIWEEIGRKFTNLSYDEADRLSRRNKEFITSLFPEGDIYTCMLSGEAREAIGQVGPNTVPVKKMLESIGFRYRNMIDPFDGGPHFWAKTSSLDPVKRTRYVRRASSKPKDATAARGLLMVHSKRGLRAMNVEAWIKGPEVFVEKAIEDDLSFEDGAEAYFLELKA